jgi:hypothetical protein
MSKLRKQEKGDFVAKEKTKGRTVGELWERLLEG